MQKARVKFGVSAGLLNRGSMRKALQKLKADVLWEEEDADVRIEEAKGLLDSDFWFICSCSEGLALRVKDWYHQLEQQFT